MRRAVCQRQLSFLLQGNVATRLR